MMRGWAFLAALAGCGAAQAQAPSANMATFAGSAEIRALIDKAAATIKPGQPTLGQPLLKFAPYSTVLEYRQATGPSSLHKDQAEIFYVVEGAAMLVQGGTLSGLKPGDGPNQSGSGITGGSERRVGPGDLFVIPENTPHWFNTIDKRLVLISMKVPRSVP